MHAEYNVAVFHCRDCKTETWPYLGPLYAGPWEVGVLRVLQHPLATAVSLHWNLIWR